VLDQALEHAGELAAGFAGLDHADVERRKRAGPAGERAGQARSGDDLVAQVHHDGVLRLAGFAQGQRVQRRAQRHAGGQQVGQLAGEQQHLGNLHARLAAEAFLELEPGAGGTLPPPLAEGRGAGFAGGAFAAALGFSEAGADPALPEASVTEMGTSPCRESWAISVRLSGASSTPSWRSPVRLLAM
jgi:hypothetical protein